MCIGRGFHKRGAATEKTLTLFDFNLVLGTWRIIWLKDFIFILFWYGIKRSVIYFRAIPCNALKTINKTFISILNITGNQCKETKTWVILSLFFVCIKSLSAAFCSNWSEITDPLRCLYIKNYNSQCAMIQMHE